MNILYESWIWRKFGNYKTLHFIVYTWIFASIFNNIADKELTKLLNANNQTIYTYNYSFGATGIILVIPAALLSLVLVAALVKIRDIFFPSLTTYKVIVFLVKMIKLLWKVVSYILASIGMLIFALAAFFSDSGGRSGGGSYRSSGGASGTSSTNSIDKQKLKREAEWEEKKAEKEAKYAWKQAAKQGNYNDKTYHFNNSVNRAKAKQREYDEAVKRNRNL
jgi:hypothetical protein